MTNESQIDFENILFPKDDEPKNEGIRIEIKRDNKLETDGQEEYCAQCDRGDFCSKHTTRAA
jgi:hypothetical protein